MPSMDYIIPMGVYSQEKKLTPFWSELNERFSVISEDRPLYKDLCGTAATSSICQTISSNLVQVTNE